MAMRYLRLDRQSGSTAFTLSSGRCVARGAQAVTNAHVDVKRVGAGDWLLRYAAHQIDADGRLVVTWDADLWSLPRGWYSLEIWIGCDKCDEVLALLGDECGVAAVETRTTQCAPCEDGCLTPPAIVPTTVPAYRPAWAGDLEET